eukprot:TRINITY_DN3736_c0_g1_i1.p1 TRINITY_DN3736_c0_g1~~TRINITY_DN3736_c0_g1_i1.p1  ORF type:complete len:196 (+),score=18.12 TRINITY_DN3736_c0_g1_i1:88-675(+)
MTPLEPIAAPTENEMPQTNTNNAAMLLATSAFSSLKNAVNLANIKPVGGFLDKDKISLPAITDIPSRVKTNLVYYHTNYIMIFLVLAVVSAFFNVSFMISLIFVGALWFYVFKWRTEPFKINQTEVPHKVTFGVLLAITLVLFYFTSIASVLFTIIIITVIFVALHSLFYTPEQVDEFGFNSGLPDQVPTAFAQV